MRHFDYVTQSEILCECCHSLAVDIHHINGRGKDKDVISNLVALCRKHHTMAHDEKISKSEMQYIHNYFLTGQRKIFIK
jgi:predicted restriction endonuclease